MRKTAVWVRSRLNKRAILFNSINYYGDNVTTNSSDDFFFILLLIIILTSYLQQRVLNVIYNKIGAFPTGEIFDWEELYSRMLHG